jgi:PhzF family phenazine biosynthesis protein
MEKLNIPIFQVDAFSNQPFHGNPAAVCPLNEWLSDELLQHIAAENNLAETAFFVAENDGFRLRWFTPEIEVELCGHATLASAWVLYHQYHYTKDSIKFYTRSGELIVTKQESLLCMDFPAKYAQEISTPNGLLEALGCTLDAIHGIYQTDDILIEFKHETSIKNLTPNFEQLKKIPTRGIITTSRAEQFDFISRWFGPRVGVNEDSVTGSAHTTLIPYWSKKISKNKLYAEQGGQRKGQLFGELSEDGQRVYISGEACLFMHGQLTLPNNITHK